MKYDEKKVHNQILQLTDYHLASIGFCLATRLRPNYTTFIDASGWGRVQPLDYALQRAKCTLDDHRFFDSTAEGDAQACIEACPHEDDFSHNSLVSFAIHSAACVAYLCLFMSSLDKTNIVWLLRNHYESAHEFSSYRNSPHASVPTIDSSRFVQGELRLQSRLLYDMRIASPKELADALECCRVTPEAKLGKLIWGDL